MAIERKRLLDKDPIVEPNMTPLIDVSLVLVVILMVATPLAFQSSLALNSASASGKRAAKNAHTERIELSVHANGTVGVNRMIVPRDALGAALRPLLANGVSPTVVLGCDDSVSHGAFVGVIDEAKSLGATRIAIVEQ